MASVIFIVFLTEAMRSRTSLRPAVTCSRESLVQSIASEASVAPTRPSTVAGCTI
jgi:hypothetical protein